MATLTVVWLTADEEPRWHELSGYFVTGLVVFRIVRGFVGTRYARFGDSVYSPATIGGYTRDLPVSEARRRPGHNPLGGATVAALLTALPVTGFTGLAPQTAEEKTGLFYIVSGHTATIGPEFITRTVADDDEEDENRKGRTGLPQKSTFKGIANTVSPCLKPALSASTRMKPLVSRSVPSMCEP